MFITKVSQQPTDVPLDVLKVTVEEIEEGKVKLPFTEKAGWLKIQKEDKLHRELMKLISNGQTPEKKRTGSYHTQLKRMYNLYRVGLLKIDNTGVMWRRHQSMSAIISI